MQENEYVDLIMLVEERLREPGLGFLSDLVRGRREIPGSDRVVLCGLPRHESDGSMKPRSQDHWRERKA